MMYRVLGGVGAAALILLATYTLGYRHGKATVQARWDATTAQAIVRDSEHLKKGMQTSFEVGARHEKAKKEISHATQTIIKKVPVYIKDTSACPVLPDGFGVLYQSSVESVNKSIAASQPDD